MNTNRIWVLGAVLLVGVAVVLGWMLGISPKLDEARTAKEERISVETQNTGYEAQLTTLKKQFESIGDLKDELAELRQAVPSGADIPVLVGQLDSIAEDHGVTLTSINVSDAQPYTPTIAAAPAADPAADPAAETAAANADTAPAAPTAATGDGAASPAAPAGSASITAENFVAIPIAIDVAGTYQDVVDFIDGLQNGNRLVMVNTFITTEPKDAVASTDPNAPAASASSSNEITASINAFVYVLLDPDSAAPATEATATG